MRVHALAQTASRPSVQIHGCTGQEVVWRKDLFQLLPPNSITSAPQLRRVSQGACSTCDLPPRSSI